MFKQLFLANWREFSRDRLALFFTFIFPVMFIGLFGLIFSREQTVEADIGIVDFDKGSISQQLITQLTALPTAPSAEGKTNPLRNLKFEHGEQPALEEKLKQGKIDALIIIPAGTSQKIEQRQQAQIELHLDQSSQFIAPLLQGVLGSITEGIDRQVTQTPRLLTIQPKSVLAENLRAIDFLVPGILAMSLMQLGLFATAMPLISMRTQGILRRLGATPLPRTTLLLAYIALRILIAFLQAVIIIGMGVLAFNVQIKGNWAALTGHLLLGTALFISIGFFVAAIAKTEESGNAITNLINFPMMFLSGIFFQVTDMPAFLKPIINAMPLTYTADALRQVMIETPPLHSQLVNIGVQVAWIVVMTTLSLRFFKWETR